MIWEVGLNSKPAMGFVFVLLAIEHVGVKFLLMLCLLFHKLFECFFFLFIWLAP